MASYPLYDALTPKQQSFIDAYLVNPNATDAARKAGYKGNDNTLHAMGAENLRKPTIQLALKERGTPQEAAKKAKILSADEVLERLSKFAASDDVEPKDSIKALELLGKRYALWQESHEIEETKRGFLVLPAKRTK